MNNFPFYQQLNAEVVCNKSQVIDEDFVDSMADGLIEKMKLSVVSSGKHEFSGQGLTKYWILSQSHLIVHTWPEFEAIQIDLITCSNLTGKKEFDEFLESQKFEKLVTF